MVGYYSGAVALLLCFLMCVPLADAQAITVTPGLESTTRIGLSLIETETQMAMDVWMNWTVRLEVITWAPEWAESPFTQPEMTLLLRATGVNFEEYSDVSFGLNRTTGGFEVSIVFMAPQHIFSSFGLGNLSGVDEQVYVASVLIRSSMPEADYVFEISIYDPIATNTSTTTSVTPTTTNGPTTTTSPTASTTQTWEPPLFSRYMIFGSILALLVVLAYVVFEHEHRPI